MKWKKEKEFDSIRMKDEIQAKLLKEYEGLTDDQIHDLRRKKIEADPLLASIFRKQQTTSRV